MSFWGFWSSYRTRTLTRDLAVWISLTVSLILVVLGGAYYNFTVAQVERDLEAQALDVVGKLADVLAVPLWDLDEVALGQVVYTYLQTPSVVAIRVFDDNGQVLYERVTQEEDLITQSSPVFYEDQEVGFVEVSLSQQVLRETRASILLTLIVVIFFVVLSIVVATGVVLQRTLNRPIAELIAGLDAIARGHYQQQLPDVPQADIDAIVERVNVMAQQIAERDRDLEQQVADRTSDLVKRSRQLKAAAEVGRVVSSILDVEQLLQEVVDLIHERFSLYHVAVFLADETGSWGIYRAGSGEVGRVMKEEGLRLEVGGRSLVGWCMANARSRVVEDVAQELLYYEDPRLPDTQAELVLPLIARGQVLGAFSIQSQQVSVFDADSIVVLETIADQVAVSLDNARLFSQTQEALAVERRSYGLASREAWAELLQSRSNMGYVRDEQGSVEPVIGEGWHPTMLRAVDDGETVQAGADTVSIPIRSRDAVLGAIRLRKREGANAWDTAEVALMESITEQFNVALEIARLYQDTQRRAARERLTSEATARMRATLDLDTVLQTAVREMGEILELAETEVRLGVGLQADESMASDGEEVQG